MWVVGATTATRDTRPSASIRWATCSPKVVLPAAGVADARNASPEWSKTAAAADCCQARRGRVVGHAGSERPTGGASIWNVTGGGNLCVAPDGYGDRVAERVPVSERGPGWTYRRDATPPSVHNAHQPGVTTPHLKHAVLAA